MTAAVSLAACTCALGLPVDVFAQTAAAPSSHAEKPAQMPTAPSSHAEKSAQPLVAPAQTPAPAASAAPAPATKHSAASATDRSANDADTKVYDTAANYNITEQDDNSITFSYVKNKNKVANPFPDVISDAEIEAAFKKGKPCVEAARFFPTKEGARTIPVDVTNTKVIPEGKGVLKQYAVFRFPNYAYPIQLFAWCAYQSRNGTIASDGSIYVGSSSTVSYKIHPGTFKLNGYTLPNNSKTRILIDVDRNNAPDNYFYYELTCPTDNNVNERVLMNGGVSMTTGGYERTSLVREFDVAADAEFHFVDDLQYHALHPEGINIDGTLKQRGNSDNHASLMEEEKKKGSLMSAKPFYEIKGLQDINGAPAITTDEALYYRTKGGDLKAPVLSFDKDQKNYIKRPTLAGLTTEKNIPGYVYWDNDIDKPNNEKHEFANDDATKETPGNHYLSFAYEMKDGKPVKRLTRKHYYVTFRALPTRLVVQYKGLDNKIKTDQAFGLYTTQNSSPALINDKLKSREAPQTKPTKDALVQMMKNANTSFLDKGAGYLSDGFAYLLPGTYMVKPTLKAPDGYEWVIETKETNKKTQADLKVSLQTKEADPTQQVVTFVLKKKPTPAPTPAPTPYPLPVPEVPAPTPAPAPVPEHKVPALEVPAPKTPATPAEAPVPVVRKRSRTLPQTGDPMASSAVGELGMMLGILSASLAATLRRKRR